MKVGGGDHIRPCKATSSHKQDRATEVFKWGRRVCDLISLFFKDHMVELRVHGLLVLTSESSKGTAM